MYRLAAVFKISAYMYIYIYIYIHVYGTGMYIQYTTLCFLLHNIIFTGKYFQVVAT